MASLGPKKTTHNSPQHKSLQLGSTPPSIYIPRRMTRPPKYRFHLDENFPAWTGKFLAERGHNVSYTQLVERGRLEGASDYHQLLFARKDKRIFITYDRDFGQHHLAHLITQSPGVIMVRGEVTRALIRKILATISTRALQGNICRSSVNSIQIMKPKI